MGCAWVVRTHAEDKLWDWVCVARACVRAHSSSCKPDRSRARGPGRTGVCRVPGSGLVSTCVTASPTDPLELGRCGKGQPAV